MYIKARLFALVYRFSTGVLSVFAAWLLFHIFGNNAWRLFPTWIMLAAVFYYVCSFFTTLLAKRRGSGQVFCPALQSILVISGILLAVLRWVFDWNAMPLTGLEGAGMALVDFILPLLFLLDWILFTKKGRWRVFDPFYSLALAICYAMGILLSAEFLNSNDAYRYPYALLDYNAIGLDVMLSWFALVSVIILALGYICFMIDFVMSGKLAKRIVLPHIKTIIIEEEDPVPVKTAGKTQSSSKMPRTSQAKPQPTAKTAAKVAAESAVETQLDPTTKPPVKPVAKSVAGPERKCADKVVQAKKKVVKPSQAKATKPTTAKRERPVALLKAEAESIKRKSIQK